MRADDLYSYSIHQNQISTLAQPYFKAVMEVLLAIGDAIKAHWEITLQDISNANIMPRKPSNHGIGRNGVLRGDGAESFCKASRSEALTCMFDMTAKICVGWLSARQ